MGTVLRWMVPEPGQRKEGCLAGKPSVVRHENFAKPSCVCCMHSGELLQEASAGTQPRKVYQLDDGCGR